MQRSFVKTLTSAVDSAGTKELEAIREICLASIAEDDQDAACLQLLGVVEYKLGNIEKTAQWLEKSLMLEPNSPEYNFNYATILAKQEKSAAAIDVMQRVIELKPNYADAYYRLGCLYQNTGNDSMAIQAYLKALSINPNMPDTLNNLGVMLQQKGSLGEAAKYYRRALEINPNYSLPLNNLGVISYLAGNLDEAEDYHRRVLAIHPASPSSLNNLGKILRQRGNFSESIELFKKALTIKPDFPEALNNLGNSFKDVGSLSEAIASYKQAILLQNDNPEFHHNLALALLEKGNFTDGWREYEWRWQTQQLAAARHIISQQPQWYGETAAGQFLLIRAEQGLGDTLQFCRYAPLAAERGLRIILEVQPSLARLMESLDGIEQVVASGKPLPSYDYYCSMMSLPLAFRTEVDTIPAAIPYLAPEKDSVRLWKSKLANEDTAILKVGLVWAGSSRHHSPDLMAVDRRRSITPAMFEPLLNIPGVRFYSLQKVGGPALKELGLIDLMEECRDFADTAAFIANLDLVISVDTAVAHLAGALGKPVWMLNRFDTCWRWLQDREDSPWYPNMHLFRQQRPGDWSDVIRRVRQALLAKLDHLVEER